MEGKHYIHFILGDQLLFKKTTNMVPSVGDEIRIKDKGSEKFYLVEKRVWVYDEPECPLNRVNLGVKLK